MPMPNLVGIWNQHLGEICQFPPARIETPIRKSLAQTSVIPDSQCANWLYSPIYRAASEVRTLRCTLTSRLFVQGTTKHCLLRIADKSKRGRCKCASLHVYLFLFFEPLHRSGFGRGRMAVWQTSGRIQKIKQTFWNLLCAHMFDLRTGCIWGGRFSSPNIFGSGHRTWAVEGEARRQLQALRNPGPRWAQYHHY